MPRKANRDPSENALIGPTVATVALSAVLAAFVSPGLTFDFVEYWAAGRLLVEGGNPYDPTMVAAIERSAGFSAAEALMMFSPPPVLTFLLPIGFLPFHVAKYIWMALLGVSFVWSITWLGDIYLGPDRKLLEGLRIYLYAIWFVPSLFAFAFGQISILVLLGLTLFLKFYSAGRMILAGAVTVSFIIKPHLVYLVPIALVADAVRTRDVRILLGMFVSGIIFALVPVSLNPGIYSHYLELLENMPVRQFATATAGGIYRWTSGNVDGIAVQFIPLILGLAFLVIRIWGGRRSDWQWRSELPVLITVSLATAAYGWVNDFVLLLPVAFYMLGGTIQGKTKQGSAVVAFLVLVEFIAIFQALCGVHSVFYFWMPLAFLLALIFLGESFRHDRHHADERPSARV